MTIALEYQEQLNIELKPETLKNYPKPQKLFPLEATQTKSTRDLECDDCGINFY